MAFSKTKIINLALSNLGVSSLIQNSVQDTAEAILMNNFYDMARDTVLEAHEWSFANAFVKIAAVEDDSFDPNFQYVFNYPSDCISPRAIIDEFDNKEKKCIPAINSQGIKVILANVDSGVLRYTKRIENEAYFTGAFVTAFAFYLAYLSAQVIVGSGNKKNTNLQDYQIAMRQAIVTDARKTVTHDQDDTIYTDCR